MAISNPTAPGAEIVIADSEVFTGTSPNVFTDLDLSGIIGVNAALVILKLRQSGVGNLVFAAFRRNGDTDNFQIVTDVPAGAAVAKALNSGDTLLVIAVTDTAGIIEWLTSTADLCTIDIVGFVRMT